MKKRGRKLKEGFNQVKSKHMHARFHFNFNFNLQWILFVFLVMKRQEKRRGRKKSEPCLSLFSFFFFKSFKPDIRDIANMKVMTKWKCSDAQCSSEIMYCFWITITVVQNKNTKVNSFPFYVSYIYIYVISRNILKTNLLCSFFYLRFN